MLRRKARAFARALARVLCAFALLGGAMAPNAPPPPLPRPPPIEARERDGEPEDDAPP